MHLIPSAPPPSPFGTSRHGQPSVFTEPLQLAADNPGEWFKLSEPVSRKSVTRARKNHGASYEITTRIEDLPRDGKRVWCWIRAKVAVVEPPAESGGDRHLEAV